jgi:hypothetical protein
MKFVVVNGRTPRQQTRCALCCEPIGKLCARTDNSALLLRSQVLRRSPQDSHPQRSKACEGVMITTEALNLPQMGLDRRQVNQLVERMLVA